MKSTDGNVQMAQCPCKSCKDCEQGFYKVVDLKNAGVVIYRHTNQSENPTEDDGDDIMANATLSTDDVFLLHNTRDNVISASEYLQELEQNKVDCPRCRRIIEHAKNLLCKFANINRNDIVSVCDHCKMIEQESCMKCDKTIKKFFSDKTEPKENIKERVKLWLAKINYLLRDAFLDNTITEQERKAYSDLYIDQIGKEPPITDRNKVSKELYYPESRQLGKDKIYPFTSDKNKIKFDLDPDIMDFEKPVTFLDHSERHKQLDSNDKKYRNIDDVRYASDVEDEGLKSRLPLGIADKDDLTGKLKKEKHVALREASSPEPFLIEDSTFGKEDSVLTGAAHSRSRSLVLDPKSIIAKEKISKKLRKSSEDMKKYHSEDDLAETDKEVLTKDFSFSFPTTSKKILKPRKRSSELIKDTRDMLLAKAEETKKKLIEEEREKKLLMEQKKLLMEQKKLAQEEKKQARIAAEIARRKEEALREAEKNEPIKEESTPKTETKFLKDEKIKNLKTVKSTVSTAVGKQTIKPPKETKPPPTPKESKPPPQPKEPKPPPPPKEPKPPPPTKEPKPPPPPKEPKPPPPPKEPKPPPAPKEPKPPPAPKEPKPPPPSKEPKPPLAPKEPKSASKETKPEQQSKKAGKEADADKKGKEDKLKQEKEEQERLRLEKEEARKDAEIQRKQMEDLKKQPKVDMEREKKAQPPIEKSPATKTKDTNQVKEEKVPDKNASDTKTKSPESKKDKTAEKDLNINKIKVVNPSIDDMILKLVKLKKGSKRPDKQTSQEKLLKQLQIDILKHKKDHKYVKGKKCHICCHSDIELAFDIVAEETIIKELPDIIIGQKIFKQKRGSKKHAVNETAPMLFQSTYKDEDIPSERIQPIEPPPAEAKIKTPDKHQKNSPEEEMPRGITRYALSDRTFIDKGWTMLPTEKVVRKINVYRMRPAHPEFDWFEHNKNKRMMQYNTGERLAEFDDNGRGRWYYRNGRLALHYYDAEELNAQQRFVIYSTGEPDERGRSQPYTILATFDYLGNGVVFDHGGKIRLKYNQTEGVVLDRNIGPVSHWKWHTLNDPPVLQQVMIDTQMPHKDPNILKMGGPDAKVRPDNEEMLAIEFDNFIKEKSKKLSQSFKPFQIKMKALKINEHFSLKVLDQATVYLIFRDGTTNLRLNIGMILDHKEIVDTDTADVGEVSSNMERLPARTTSLDGLQKSVAFAQRFERSRAERGRRLRRPEPFASADQLTAAASRPLQPPLRTAPSGVSLTTACKCSRRPSASNVYYDTRLF